MPKKKIAIFHCAFIYSGGGERIIFEEVWGLKKRGYQVEIVGQVVDRQNCFPDLIGKVGISTFLPQLPRWFPYRHALTILASCIFAPAFAKRFSDVDIFYGADQPGIWMAYIISKILRKPFFVYMNHPNRGFYPRVIQGRIYGQTEASFKLIYYLIQPFRWILKKIDRAAIFSASAHFSNGDYIKHEIDRVYGINCLSAPAGCYPIPPSFLPTSPRKAYVGNIRIGRYKFAKPYILCAGRHESWKKFEYAITAMPKILKKIPNLSLIIPGSPTSHTPNLKALSKKLKVQAAVKFIGKISEKELMKLYKEAALFVFTSPKEDFGMVVIEQAAYGIPVVAWRMGGPTTSIIDGKTGYLAKPYSVSDFTQKIIYILKNPLKRFQMGRAAWEHVRKNFSWKSHIDKISSKIEEIMLK